MGKRYGKKLFNKGWFLSVDFAAHNLIHMLFRPAWNRRGLLSNVTNSNTINLLCFGVYWQKKGCIVAAVNCTRNFTKSICTLTKRVLIKNTMMWVLYLVCVNFRKYETVSFVVKEEIINIWYLLCRRKMEITVRLLLDTCTFMDWYVLSA